MSDLQDINIENDRIENLKRIENHTDDFNAIFKVSGELKFRGKYKTNGDMKTINEFSKSMNMIGTGLKRARDKFWGENAEIKDYEYYSQINEVFRSFNRIKKEYDRNLGNQKAACLRKYANMLNDAAEHSGPRGSFEMGGKGRDELDQG